MKKSLLTLSLLLFFHGLEAQNKWFSTYIDSIALVSDANENVSRMVHEIKKIRPEIQLNVKAIKNTKPYLIFIKDGNVNLPFWEEIMPQQKKFFAEVAGGEKEGREVFGLFFNGFYLAHELGHAIAGEAGVKHANAYDSEYAANVLAILYWKEHGEAENLEKCYWCAKKMLSILKSPVPEGEDYKNYFTLNYSKLASDPYKYGYIQFSQFVEIYENKMLPDFRTYVNNFMRK